MPYRQARPVSVQEARRRGNAATVLNRLQIERMPLTDDVIAALCRIPASEALEARKLLVRAGRVRRGTVRTIGGGKRAVAWRAN